MAEAATIRGTVLGHDGSPLANRAVWVSPIGEAMVPGIKVIDTHSDGTYLFDRLWPGKYRIWTETLVGAHLLQIESEVEASAGTATTYDLSFSRFVEVKGTVRFGGNPPPIDGFRLDLMPKTRGPETRPSSLLIDTNGNFNVFLLPGSYQVGVVSPPFGLAMLDKPVEVPEGSRSIEFNWDIPTVDATIRIVPMAGEAMTTGTVTAEYRTWEGSQTTRIEQSVAEAPLRGLVPGTYSLGFFVDTARQGDSGPVEVGPGRDNVFTIELRKPEDRAFLGTFTLPPGRYEYKFFAPADLWIPDGLNPMTSGDGVFTNSVFEVPGGAKLADGTRAPWPKVNDRTGEVTFWVRMPSLYDRTYLRGSFNGWRLDPTFALERRAEKTFELVAKIPPGTYEYKYYFPEEVWFLDPNNPNMMGDGVFQNSVLVVPEAGLASPTPDGVYPRFLPETGEVVFRATLATPSDQVFIRGTFNNWEMQDTFRLKPTQP